MAATMDDVRAYLDAEEVDYEAAALLGAEALPLLEQLVHGDDPMLASKATYLASLIPGDQRSAILADAATSPVDTVRVAAASGLANLEEADAATLADGLLGDTDVGVRKQALRSVSGFASTWMVERVRRVAEDDPADVLRTMAAESLRER